MRSRSLANSRREKGILANVVDERRPEFGHSALLALSTEISEQPVGIENSEALAVDDAGVQQPDRQVGPVDPTADDRYFSVGHRPDVSRTAAYRSRRS